MNKEFNFQDLKKINKYAESIFKLFSDTVLSQQPSPPKNFLQIFFTRVF